MSDMSLSESYERFREGTAKAADRCKQLSDLYSRRQCGETSAVFSGFSNALMQILIKGEKIKNSRGKNRTDTLAALDRILKNNAIVENGK